jgi:chromosome segregation ATPase
MENLSVAYAENVAKLESTSLEQNQRYKQEIANLKVAIAEKETTVKQLDYTLFSCHETLALNLQVEAALTDTAACLEITNDEARLRITECVSTITELNDANAEKDNRILFLSNKIQMADTMIKSLIETQKTLEEHAAKRKAHAKYENREWRNMLNVMQFQRETVSSTSEQLLSEQF